MTKPRRKDEIRRLAQSNLAAVRPDRKSPDQQDWRAIALDAILHGSSITSAARLAGVPRHRIYTESIRCNQFGHAFELARHYGRNRIIWVSRPIWPPSAQTVERHAATYQRIKRVPRCELVGPDK